MSRRELKLLSAEVRNLAITIGGTLREMRAARALDINRKGRSNFVTDADMRAHEMLLAGLSRILPGVGILSEESSHESPPLDGPLWIVDPIDGTTNFVRGIPFSGVSIALCEQGRPILGVIHSIFVDETTTAFEGGGAERDGTPLRVSGATSLDEAIITTGFPYPEDRNSKQLASVVRAFLDSCGDIRRMGAASVDGAFVAAGLVDAYYESVELWDAAAARIVVMEAGGTVGNVALSPEDTRVPPQLRSRHFLCASSQELYRLLEGVIKDAHLRGGGSCIEENVG